MKGCFHGSYNSRTTTKVILVFNRPDFSICTYQFHFVTTFSGFLSRISLIYDTLFIKRKFNQGRAAELWVLSCERPKQIHSTFVIELSFHFISLCTYMNTFHLGADTITEPNLLLLACEFPKLAASV